METTFMKGGKVTKTDVDTDFLGDVVRVRLLRHAVRMYENNQRAGTHKVKTRAEIAFRKGRNFKQKGTGRARVRRNSVPQCYKGGVAHGPKPRDYGYQMPKRAKVEALRSALLSKFRDGEVAVTDSLAFAAPRTKELKGKLDSLGMTGSCLIVTHDRDDNLLLSARNLRRVHVMPVEELNAYHLLYFRNLLITEAALDAIREKTNDEA